MPIDAMFPPYPLDERKHFHTTGCVDSKCPRHAVELDIPIPFTYALAAADPATFSGAKHFTLTCTLEDGRQANVNLDLESGVELMPVSAMKDQLRMERLLAAYKSLGAFVEGPDGPPLPPELANVEL